MTDDKRSSSLCSGLSAYARRGQSPLLRMLRPFGLRPSLPGEDRLALLQEGAASLDVVLAGETARHEARQARKVALALGLHGLDGDLLERRDGERRIGGDSLRVLLHV